MQISDSKTGIRLLRLEFIEGMKCMQIHFSFSITIKLGLVVHKQDRSIYFDKFSVYIIDSFDCKGIYRSIQDLGYNYLI